jgi:signal transduction histidine kinase/ligand-binding sensor domain-containing protein
VSVAFDRTGALWLAYPNLVAVVSPEELRRQNLATQPSLAVRSLHNVTGVRMMAEDGAGAMWVIRRDLDNSVIIDTRSEAITTLVPRVSSALPTGPFPITCLRADRSGDMWLGTNGLGIVHQARSYGRFPLLTHENGLTVRSLRSIEQDHDGSIWVGGYSSRETVGLNRLDTRTNTTVTYGFGTGPVQVSSHAFWTLLADPADDRRTVWLGADGSSGVIRMRPPYRTGDLVTPTDQDVGSIRSLYRDQRDRLWTGTTTGLHRIDDQRLRSYRPVIDQRGNTDDVVRTLTTSTILHITELSATPDLLWCSTEAGLLCYDPATGRGTLWQASDQPSALRSSLALSVHEDRQGRVWVATGGAGIAHVTIASARTAPLPAISDATFRHYTSSEGLPNDYVYGILDGDQDELWMSTNAGIVRFNPATGSFRSYDVVDGLQNNEFNKNAFFRSKSGELFFGGVMGLNRFYPSAITDNPHVPEIVVTDLKVFNRSRTFPVSISWLDEVTLEADDRVITFEFVALDYRVSARNRYRYQLEGFDPRWIENGTSRTATYTDLDPGTYTFHVTGTNNDGVWNPTGTSIRLVMLPPFWKTWWFRGISIALLVGVLYGGFRMREREMARRHRELEDRVRERTAEWEAANNELEAFSYTVSHDLRAPVRAINGYSQMLLKEHAAELTPGALRKLEIITTRTKRMGTMIDDLLTFSRLGRQALLPTSVDMTALVRGLVQELLPADGRVTVQVGQLPSASVDASLIRQVWINLLSNAVKFSSAVEKPVVSVGGHGRGNAIVYWVKDNGVGFDMIYQDKLFRVFERLHSQDEFEGTGVGLAIVARVIKRHGGRVWAESRPGQGATFSFELPTVPPASA